MVLRAAWKISKWSHACRHRSKAKRFPKNQTCMPIAPRAGLVGCDVYSPWPLPGTIALIPRVVLASSCRGPVALTPAVAGDCCAHPAGRTGQLRSSSGLPCPSAGPVAPARPRVCCTLGDLSLSHCVPLQPSCTLGPREQAHRHVARVGPLPRNRGQGHQPVAYSTRPNLDCTKLYKVVQSLKYL